MKKHLAITFILGALIGGGISAFFFSGKNVTKFLPGEVKVLTKTEYRTIQDDSSSDNEPLYVPKYPEPDDEDYVDPVDMAGYEAPIDEASDAPATQIEKFERSLAGEAETTITPPEELSTTVPEEAPAENPNADNPDSDNTEEDDPK